MQMQLLIRMNSKQGILFQHIEKNELTDFNLMI